MVSYKKRIQDRIKRFEEGYDPRWDNVMVSNKRVMEWVVEVLKEILENKPVINPGDFVKMSDDGRRSRRWKAE